MDNIWLIGMPGCGKTTVGRLLAGLSGGLFIDLDVQIEHSAGMGIPEIFRQRGEVGFRTAETAALNGICRKENIVVATGGGIILKAGNVRIMKQSGTVVFLDRPLAQLERDMSWGERPLLQAGREALIRIYNERIGLYRSACDITVPVSGTPEQTAQAVYDQIFAEKAPKS